MKREILKTAVIVLAMFALLLALNGRGTAQDSRDQDTATAIPPAEKTVDQVFKNIRVLNGTPQSQLYPTMRFMAASLGFQCGNCHVIGDHGIDSAADDKPEKQTARQMIRMVIEINKTYAQGNPMVSCYTCHRGQRAPQGAPILPLLAPSGPASTAVSPGSKSGSPSADEVLSKYLDAIGGKAAAGMINSCVVKGTTSTAVGPVVAYEAVTRAPDKGHETFAVQNVAGLACARDSRCEYERVINGRRGWVRNGQGVQELAAAQLADQKLSFPLFSILKMKDQYSSFLFSGRDQIDDRDVFVLSARRFDDKAERLYFDVESGLLRRRISYTRTLIGTIPQQTDFEDYQEVQGLRLPFTIRISFADPGSRMIVRKFTEIKLNVPMEESSFEKPR